MKLTTLTAFAGALTLTTALPAAPSPPQEYITYVTAIQVPQVWTTPCTTMTMTLHASPTAVAKRDFGELDMDDYDELYDVAVNNVPYEEIEAIEEAWEEEIEAIEEEWEEEVEAIEEEWDEEDEVQVMTTTLHANLSATYSPMAATTTMTLKRRDTTMTLNAGDAQETTITLDAPEPTAMVVRTYTLRDDAPTTMVTMTAR